jgi:predicted dehydrogenase
MKVLIAGLGSIGQRHLRNLRAVLGDGAEILAHRVVGRSSVISDAMAIEDGDVERKYGVRAFTRLDEALAQRPEAVFICNPTSHHVATAMAALGAGCHVLIEKPLSDCDRGVDQLIEVAERSRLVAAVGYQMRCHPALLHVRELLRDGAIGPVRSVRAEMGEYLPDAHPYEDYRTSYAARADLGGGVILCYIHEFDYVCWLFGMPRRVATVGGRLGQLDIDVEDTASSVLECMADGRSVAVHVQQSFLQRPPSRTCEIVGEHGTIRADLRTATVRVSVGAAAAQEVSFRVERNQLFLDELRHFLAAVAGRPAPIVTAREAAQSLRVALAAKASMASGQMVTLS